MQNMPNMNHLRRIPQAAIVLLILTVSVHAAPVPSDSVSFKRFKWGVYPLAYYTPETRIAVGGSATFLYKKNPEEPRPSSLIPYFVYTQNKQFIGQLELDLYFSRGDYHLYSMFEYKYYPDKFYGIGNNTPESNEEAYTSKIPLWTVSFLRRIHAGLNAGLQFDFTYHDITEVKDGGLLAQKTVPGSEGGIISGLSLVATWDTRDNTFSSRVGNYFYFSAGYFGKLFGCNFDFVRFVLDLRHFMPVFSKHTLAFQGYLISTLGDVPLQSMGQLGGSSLMRGFYKGRYRDKNMALLQMEYRVPVYWRFGAAVFAGIGDVFSDYGHMGCGNLKYSVGGGIRFALDPRERLTIRADIGFASGGDIGFYFKAMEAF